jgi:hypothetical protein
MFIGDVTIGRGGGTAWQSRRHRSAMPLAADILSSKAAAELVVFFFIM